MHFWLFVFSPSKTVKFCSLIYFMYFGGMGLFCNFLIELSLGRSEWSNVKERRN